MRIVPIECVREGTILGKTIYDDDGRILLKEGVALWSNVIEKIKSLQIYSLYINDEYSNAEIEDIIKPELRQKAISTIKDTFKYFEKSNVYKSDEYLNSLNAVVNEIMEELFFKKNILINVVDIKSMDNYTYQHCVNVAVISMIIGIKLQLNKKELYNLCMGGMLHDIGKILVPKEVILKEGPLTQEEYEIVKKHTTLGYEYLKKIFDISPVSRIIILQHHERVDGKGYPENKNGQEINKLAKIVAVADVYDALTSDRPYRKAMSANDALEYIMAGTSTQFDYVVVSAFVKVVIPYPQDSVVRLNNGEIGVIKDIFPNSPLRPKIKILKSDNVERVGKEISLLEELTLIIEGIEHEI